MEITISGTRATDFKVTLDKDDIILQEMLTFAEANGMELVEVVDEYLNSGKLDGYIDTCTKIENRYYLDCITLGGKRK